MDISDLHTYIEGGSTVASAFFTGWAALAASRAAKAAARQTEFTAKQLISDQRAWISLEVLPVGDIVMSPDGIQFQVVARLTNVGKTPAVNVHTSIETIAQMRNSHIALKEFGEKNRTLHPEYSRLLQPGESYDRPWNPGIPTELPFAGGKGPMADALTPTLLACVTYQTLHDDILHQTAMSYMIGRKSPGDLPGYGSLLQMSDSHVPHEQIDLAASAGGYAD